MNKSVVENALGGVISAAVVAGLTWFFDLWPTLKDAVSDASGWVWTKLSYQLPVWSVFLFALLPWMIARISSWWLQAKRTPNVFPLEESDLPPLEGLSSNGLLVLRALAAVDGQAMLFDDLADRIGLSRLYTERAVEELFARRLIETHRDFVYGNGVLLSRKGRDCAIEAGMVQERKLSSRW